MQDAKIQVTALPTKGLIHLFNVYIFWSGTYLAIKVAEEAGLTIFTLGASRMLAGGLILLSFACFTGSRVRPSFKELRTTAISGCLLWIGGNGLVMWAERYANSGFAALTVASAPIWTAFFDCLIKKKKPSLMLTGSLLLGFLGLCVLMAPSLINWNYSELFAGLSLIIAAISMACGSIFQARNPINLSAEVSSGYQHLFASIGFIILGLTFNESWSVPASGAWFAWSYLVIFGSVVAFTSFVYSLRLLPINIAMTYAYVNPTLALFLGWVFLDESITIWTATGAVMVILGVVGVFKTPTN